MNTETEESILFRDRNHAGQLLAAVLKDYSFNPQATLFALPRGGVPVAYEIAKALRLPLDIILVRKLGAPSNPEYAIGALAFDGTCIWNEEAVKMLGVSEDEMAKITWREQQELLRREQYYRHGKPMLTLENRIAILVDDGLATGLTMRAAVLAIRKLKPQKIIVAVPVAALSTYQEFSKEVDKIFCLHTPQHFLSVGKWYEDFRQLEDEEVCTLLAEIKNLH